MAVTANSDVIGGLNSGIVPDLRKVLDLAMANELDVPQMLKVVESLLIKALARDDRAENREEIEAALSVVSAIQQYMQTNPTLGANSQRARIVNKLHAEATWMISNSARHAPGGVVGGSDRERLAVIANAGREWDGIGRSNQRLCNRDAWVSMALQDRGMSRLSPEEAQAVANGGR